MAHFRKVLILVVIVVGAFAVSFPMIHANAAKNLMWYDCRGGSHCNLETYTWEHEWDASQNTIQTIRRCQSLFVQKENEEIGAFVARIPKNAIWPCMILRKSPQPHAQISGDNWRNSTWMGGTFEGASK